MRLDNVRRWGQREPARCAAGCSSDTLPCRRLHFTRGVRWAPDGTCVATAGEDGLLRIFNAADLAVETPAEGGDVQDGLRPAVQFDVGESVRDWAWFPGMASSAPETCALAVVGKGSPVQLVDAYTGGLRASYSPYNDKDELASAFCGSFNSSGARLYCGCKNTIHAFDTGRPGRQIASETLASATIGLPSSMAFSPTGQTYVCGSFQGGLCVLAEDVPSRDQPLFLVHPEELRGGITAVAYGGDGVTIVAGGRGQTAHDLLVYDMRSVSGVGTTQPIFRLRRHPENRRSLSSQQRLGLAVDHGMSGRVVASGAGDGFVRMWDLDTGEEVGEWQSGDGCCAGVDFSKCEFATHAVATVHGQRRFTGAVSDDEDDTGGYGRKSEDNLKIWRLNLSANA